MSTEPSAGARPPPRANATPVARSRRIAKIRKTLRQFRRALRRALRQLAAAKAKLHGKKHAPAKANKA